MPISTASKLLQKVAARLQLSPCPTFFVLLFIFTMYCGGVDFQRWLCFRRLGATSDLHGCASLLALGSVARVGYYGELDATPCAAEHPCSDCWICVSVYVSMQES